MVSLRSGQRQTFIAFTPNRLIENASGKSVEPIRQDVYAKQVAHNLTALLTMGAQAQVDERCVGRKPRYTINFNQVLSCMKIQILHVLRKVVILSRIRALC